MVVVVVVVLEDTDVVFEDPGVGFEDPDVGFEDPGVGFDFTFTDEKKYPIWNQDN